MNASKQEMFESVRAVVAGRLRDDAQVRELAYRVSEESTALRRRLERAVSYARAGLRLEACAEAEAEPSIFELSAAFDTDVMKQWRTMCAKNRLPLQDDIPVEAVVEIEEAIALTAPLRSRLALMRRLVLSDASAWHRLEALRELVSRDPDNPAWQEDRAALEPVAADELGNRFENDLESGNLEDAEFCVLRLEDGKWHWSAARKIGAQLRSKLDRALATRTAGEARQVVGILEVEWSAENEEGARSALSAWRELEQRMISYGGEMPGELLSKVDEAEVWLAARESAAAAQQASIDSVRALERVVQDERSTLMQLRAALRTAEQTIDGVPDDLRGAAQRRIDAYERAARMKRVLTVVALVAIISVAAVGAVIVLKKSEASKRVDDVARAILANVTTGRLDEAERQLSEAEKEPALAGSVQITEAREKLVAARKAISDQHAAFAELLAEAGDPTSAGAKPEHIEEAKRLSQSDEEQGKLADWLRKYTATTESRRNAQLQEGVSRAKAISREIAAAVPGADASWDGKFTAWESALTDTQRQYSGFAEVKQEVDGGRRVLEAQRAKVQAQRTDLERVGSLAGLGAFSDSPSRLVAALQKFLSDHPDATERSDFASAISAEPTWNAVVSWAEVQARPTASLANANQKDRDAAASAVAAYLSANPTTPYLAACEAVEPLLAPAPLWRAWLTEKLTTAESFLLWSIERKDGSRRYCRTDPRKIALQTLSGVAVKSVLILDGKAKKETYEKFEQSQIKSEGPSPGMTVAKQVLQLLDDDEKSVNDIDAQFDVLSALRDNDTLDGAPQAIVMRGLLETMLPEVPAMLRSQCEIAIKKISREKPEEIDWMNPRDTEARGQSRALNKLIREVVQPDQWRKAYNNALSEACATLAVIYQPVGVLVKPGGALQLLTSHGASVPAGTTFWIADPPIGAKLSVMVKLATRQADGSNAFEAGASTVPAGTMVFRLKSGVKP